MAINLAISLRIENTTKLNERKEYETRKGNTHQNREPTSNLTSKVNADQAKGEGP